MNRIELLASLAHDSKCLCDIGCDHAYVLIEAIKKHDVEKGLACDVADGPLQMAKKSIVENHLYDRISIIKSDGFKNVELDFDCAIIAGMGGSLISDILEASKDKIKNKKLILQPNNDRDKVREKISSLGFKITLEHAIIDQNKYYEIMVCEMGSSSYDLLDLKYGPLLRRNKSNDYINHYTKQYNQLKSIIPNVNNNPKLNELLAQLRELQIILCEAIMEKEFILNTKNYYTTYFIDDTKRNTIIVSPGGGYQYTSPRESLPVANVFNKLGYHVIVVNYRETVEDAYPKTAEYLAHVIAKFRNDSRVNKIIGLGFSAGGHNILEVSLHNEKYEKGSLVDLLMLGYPVVTSDERYWHQGSFKNLLLNDFDNLELRKYLSFETQVNKNAPDLFLWGTITDESVHVMNSILLVQAYKEAGCNCEYHMFPMGGHGLSVCNNESAEENPAKIIPYLARWADMANEWIKNKLK